MKSPWLLQNRIFRFIILNLLIAIAYAIGVTLSQKFATLAGAVASVWFPSGMTLALVYLLGNRVLLGIICGSVLGIFPSLLAINPPISFFDFILINAACALGNTLQPLIATYLIKKFIKKFAHRKNIFNHVNTVVVYIGAAIFSPMISATFGITSLCLTVIIPWNAYGVSWSTWWLASAIAHLIFTPTLLLFKGFWQNYRQYNLIEIGLTLSLFLSIAWFSFTQKYPLAYMLLPALLWTVFRLGNFTANLLVSLISLIAIFSTSQGLGLYIKDSPNESLLLLQSFMAVFSLTSLILSAVISERKEAQLSLKKALESLEMKVIERTEKLQQSEAQINGFFSSAPIGMGIVDRNLRYVRVNQVLAEINHKSVEEHLGATLQEILPNLTTNAADSFYRVLETGESLLNQEFTSRVLSINGEEQTWLTSFFPIFSVDHVASYVGFVVVEISDRKKAEANMQYAESVLRQANLELEKLVNIDGLTQIANRRCFNDRLEFEWERLAREQQPLSLILFDLDYFKRYNDGYGHQMGDDCLIKVAQATQQTVCRPADLVARYGGEEFVVILPNTDLDGAIAVADQIHSAIMSSNIPHQNSDISDIVTISLGVTSLIPNLNQVPSILIKQADVALYSAKQQGRDRSVTFSA